MRTTAKNRKRTDKKMAQNAEKAKKAQEMLLLTEYLGVTVYVAKGGAFHAEGLGVNEKASTLHALRQKIRRADPSRTDIPKKGTRVAFYNHNARRWMGGTLTGKRSIENSESVRRISAHTSLLEENKGLVHVEVKVYKKFLKDLLGKGFFLVPLRSLRAYNNETLSEMQAIEKQRLALWDRYKDLDDKLPVLLAQP